MKSRSEHIASSSQATLAAIFATVALALIAFAFSASSASIAYADDAEGDGTSKDAKTETVELTATTLESETGAAKDYNLYAKAESLDADSLEKGLSNGDVTVTETTTDEGKRFIDITASKDTPIAIVLAQTAGGKYLESALPDGALKADVHYLMPIDQETKLTSIELYQSKDADADSSDDDAKAKGAGATDPGLLLPPAEDDPDQNAGTDTDGGNDQQGESGQGGNAGTSGDSENGDNSGDSGSNASGTSEDGQAGGSNANDGNADDNNGNSDAAAQSDNASGNDGNAAADDDAKAKDEGNGNAAADQPAAATTYAIVIGKVDSKSGEALKGAEFQLKNPDGGVVSTWTTNGGNHQVDGLSKDVTYVLEETKAPDGYNRERPINVKYDSASGKVLIDQGGASKALDNNDSGNAVLTVKDVQGSSAAQTSASTSPKTGDSLPVVAIAIGLVAVVAIAAAVAVKARKKGKEQ